jgi:TolB protein
MFLPCNNELTTHLLNEYHESASNAEHRRTGRWLSMNTLREPIKNERRNVVSILEMVDINTGERMELAKFDHLIEAPNWTLDGNRLIYNSEGLLYFFDLATRESTLIDSGYASRCNNDHVLSPDNSRIAVSHHTKEDGQSRIYVIPFEGGQPILITALAPSYLHGWSPDGLTLSYCAERNGQYDIYTIPVSGGVEIQLTDTLGLDDGPEYSPDGRYIWFNSTRAGLMQIWRMNADGSEQTQMTFDESNNWFPHLSPDGATVAFLSYRKGDVAPADHPPNKEVEIRLIASGGGQWRTLVSLFGGQGTINVNSWSPDSSKLAFVSYRLND